MHTPRARAGTDAPPNSGERSTAALDLAAKLRQELLRERRRKSPLYRPPAYRLVHHLDGEPARGEDAADPAAVFSPPPSEAASVKSAPYVGMNADELKRLQRLAHLLTALSGELNLLLAGCQHLRGEASL
jgi:hypothetical protein